MPVLVPVKPTHPLTNPTVPVRYNLEDYS